MSDLTQTREIFAPIEGTLIAPADFVNITDDIDSAAGQLIRAIGGPNFLPNVDPLVLAPGAGMTVDVGGAGQGLIAQGRFLDVCPQTALPIAAAGGADRVDLIAVKATRVAGTMTVARTVVPDSAPSDALQAKLVLANGTATYVFAVPFSAPPTIAIGVEGADALGQISLAISATQVVVTSADATDTRKIDLEIFGSVPGAAGATQNVELLENRPAYTVVTGNSTLVPPTPDGYETLASVYVHANEATIAAADITVYFEQLASPILDAIFRNLTVTTLAASGSIRANNGFGAPLQSNSSLGNVSVGALAASGSVTTPVIAGVPAFEGDGENGFGQLTLQDTVRSDFTQRKHLRANGNTGAFEITNDTGTAVILALTDSGALSIPAGMTVGGVLEMLANAIHDLGAVTGSPAFQGDGQNSSGQLSLQDTVRNAAPQSKHLRSNGTTGCFEIVNSAGTTVIFQLHDTGAVSIAVSATITGNGSDGAGLLVLEDTTTTASAPIKRLRANGTNGRFEIVNTAANEVVFAVDDLGNVFVIDSLTIANLLNVANGIEFTVGGAISATAPSIGNDSKGGINAVVPKGTQFGWRWFTYDGESLIQLAQLDASGDLTLLGNLSVGGNIVVKAITMSDKLYMGGHDVVNAGNVGAQTVSAVGEITAGSYGGPLVTSIEGITGAATLASPDDSVAISTAGESIEITAALPATAFGATNGRNGNASIAMPSNGRTYNVFVRWFVNANQDTPTIAAANGVGGFVTVAGSNGGTGSVSAAHYAMAACTAVANGQALNFTLSSSGGSSTGAGYWEIQAFAD